MFSYSAAMGGNLRRLRTKPTSTVAGLEKVEEGLLSVDIKSGRRRNYGARGFGSFVAGRVSTPHGDFSQMIESEATHLPLADAMAVDIQGDDGGQTDDMDMDDIDGSSSSLDMEVLNKEKKKKRQMAVWMETVIPAMVQPYLQLLRETGSLRDLTFVRKGVLCSGCVSGRVLEVFCVFFDRVCFLSF